VSDVDNDSDDTDGDLEDLVSPNAAPADSTDDECSANEDDSPVDSDEDDDGWGEKFRSTNAPKAFDVDHGPFLYMSPETAAIEYFELLFPETLWQLLVTETTRYAEQRNAVRGDDVTTSEISPNWPSAGYGYSPFTTNRELLEFSLGSVCSTICTGHVF